MGGRQLKAAAVDVNVLMLGQCSDARHRSFRSSPSFADQSQLPIHRRSIAAADLCAGSGRGGERGNPITLGLFAIDLSGLWQEGEFRIQVCPKK